MEIIRFHREKEIYNCEKGGIPRTCNHDNYISERDKKFPLVSFPPPLVANQIFLSTLPVNATMYNAKLEIVHGQVLNMVENMKRYI